MSSLLNAEVMNIESRQHKAHEDLQHYKPVNQLDNLLMVINYKGGLV